MNVGVIGGSGFIGSHVVDKLLEKQHQVTVFDIRKPHRDDLTYIYIDITDLAKTAVALTGYYDVVYLLAAVADVNDVYNSPVESTVINVLGVANVLEAARRNNIGRVVLASTIWVYGLTAGTNLDEGAPFSVGQVDHVYTAQKVSAELLCHSYQKVYGQKFTVLRYGIPYGPRARGGTVLATFVRRAFRGEPLTVMGDGRQYRNFIYVEDLAEGNVAALKEAAINQTYNLEGGRPVTVREVAETVQKLVGNVEIQYTGARTADFQGRTISFERARAELSWEPRVDFQEGAKRYVEWYRKFVLPVERP